MFSSEAAISRGMTSSSTSTFLFPDNSVMQNEFLKSRGIMGSDHQSGGLMRNRSAPSSFFDGMMESTGFFSGVNDGGESFMLNDGSSSSDSETMFSSMLNCNGSGSNSVSDSRDLKNCMQFMKQEIGDESQKQGSRNENGTNSFEVQQMVYEAPEMGSLGVETQLLRNPSNLIRHSSSPAGFFSGFDMREAGSYKASNGANNGDGFNNHINYSSAQSSSSNYMPSIAENDSWNDSSYNCLKRTRNGDFKMLSTPKGIESQDGEPRNRAPGLIHHMSLPSTSVEMEKYLHFQQDFQQDTVLCKTRAKRGCATHPRSIAERNRRTRISERMKKLQELFPKMDKQTSTSDMLDWAVEHIKQLQNQVQILTDKRAKCTCFSKD